MAEKEPHPLKMAGMALPPGRWLLLLPTVRDSLKQAWLDSQPGVTGGHEEGGFILTDDENNVSVRRWHKGEQDTIMPPPYADCRVDDKEIIATFHTHPNTGNNYLQEPSETDQRAVKDDPDLKGTGYEGEYVISAAKIYIITPSGDVIELGETNELLEL